MKRWDEEEFDPLPLSLGGRRKPFQEEEEENILLNKGMQSLAVDSYSEETDEDGSTENESGEEIELPDWACKYCGLHDVNCVAKCNGCQKWFCNQIGQSSGSHMVQHLVKARHKEITCHPDGPIGDAVIECYNCGCRNIFLLGYIPAKADTLVVLLCRTPCAASASETWDVSSWEPLINNRALLSWLVKIPDEAAMVRSKKVTSQQINRLEEVWRARPDATIETMEQVMEAQAGDGGEAELKPVPLRFDNAFDYRSVFGMLVAAEADCDRQLKEGQRVEGLNIRWERGLNGAYLAMFTLPRAEEFRLALGDEIIVKDINRPSFSAVGVIIRSPMRTVATEEVCLEIRQYLTRIPDDGPFFNIEFVWKPTSYDRMMSALKLLAVDDTCVDPIVFQKLMGHDIDEPEVPVKPLSKVSAPNLPELNHSQAHAVKTVLGRPLSLIQGPPGTGKTVTSATIVYHLAQLEEGPILVTAPSNVAVDHLTEKIHQLGLRVVRLAAKWREDVDTAVSFLSLHEQVRNNLTRPDLVKLQQQKDQKGQLSKSDEEKYMRLLRASEQDILRV